MYKIRKQVLTLQRRENSNNVERMKIEISTNTNLLNVQERNKLIRQAKKLTDLEDRSRRNNLRIDGEGARRETLGNYQK